MMITTNCLHIQFLLFLLVSIKLALEGLNFLCQRVSRNRGALWHLVGETSFDFIHNQNNHVENEQNFDCLFSDTIHNTTPEK